MRELKIYNVRMGFATNSSSSHSIIFIKGGARDNDVSDHEFGWEYFTAASSETKRWWLAAQAYIALSQFTPGEVAADILRDMYDLPDISFEKHSYTNDGSGHINASVDHQSVLTFPRNWLENDVHRQFLAQFSDFILQDGVAILGGNDNDDHIHPLYNAEQEMPTSFFGGEGRGNLVARWDSQYAFWTLFNRRSGGKMRLAFDDITLQRKVTRAETPELVDIKITDYCTAGCAFCYQDSTPEGVHGNTAYIKRVLDTLSELQVFEAALGGGETTQHPDFVEILQYARDKHIVPNFTTKRLDWLRNKALRTRVLELCGAFAYSATSEKDVKNLIRQLAQSDCPASKAMVQCVMGVVQLDELARILHTCAEANIRVTLLGYKTAGRGKSVMPSLYKDWFTVVERVAEKDTYLQIGIDTALAEQFDAQLKARGVDTRFYHVLEGAFSAYVDAVKGSMGPSSYGPREELLPLPDPQDFVAKYRAFVLPEA